MDNSKAEKLFETALSLVDSGSIRAWAQSEHNRPIFIKLAQNMLNNGPDGAHHKLATLIVSNAIGL